MSDRPGLDPRSTPFWSNRRQGAFNIVIMGDFRAGNADVLRQPLKDRVPVAIDVDDFDQVLERFAPRITLAKAGNAELSFRKLEDFHPDTLLEKVEALSILRSHRDRLRNSSELSVLTNYLSAPPPALPAPAGLTPTANDVSTLSRSGRPRIAVNTALVESPPASRSEAATLDGFLKQLISPQLQSFDSSSPRRQALREVIDRACTQGLRAVLHDPTFQLIEARWRLIYELTSRLDNEGELKLYLLDVAKEELAQNLLQAGQSVESSGLYQALQNARRTLGDDGWGLLLGDFQFGPSASDVAILNHLGPLAKRLNAPFIAQAQPQLLGLERLSPLPPLRAWPMLDSANYERWQRLRHVADADWLGLSLPRLLVRPPYSSRANAIEAFEFDELEDENQHDALLWGNSAFGVAALIGESYLADGWELQLGEYNDLDKLPTHTYRQGSDTLLYPCAEVLLNERTADAISAQGLIALVSYRNQNSVRVSRFQSLADPPKPLAGGWHSA